MFKKKKTMYLKILCLTKINYFLGKKKIIKKKKDKVAVG